MKTIQEQINSLPRPKKQIEEVLYYLIKRHNINRKQMMLDTGVLNVTARIADLRNRYFLDIVCNQVSVKNKFGRKIEFGYWSLSDKAEGLKIYKKLQNK